jgi:hypothetical protein
MLRKHLVLLSNDFASTERLFTSFDEASKDIVVLLDLVEGAPKIFRRLMPQSLTYEFTQKLTGSGGHAHLICWTPHFISIFGLETHLHLHNSIKKMNIGTMVSS